MIDPDHGARLLYRLRQRVPRLKAIRRGIGHREHATERGVEIRFLPQHRRKWNLVTRNANLATGRLETFGVVPFVFRGYDKIAARVLDAVGKVPLAGNLSALGRIGAFNGRSSSSLNGSDSGTDVKVGLGLQYGF